ncbi:MAG: type II toxin-antitoxin system VapC family toxin [Terracidiphilus sp.]|jgi:predicted nucleic acid-binding protein
MSQPPRIVLDTTVLIDALRNRNRRRSFLAGLAASGQELVTSTICVAEVYGGLCPGEEQATQALLAALEWIPVSPAIAERAGKMKADLRRQGQTRSIADMIVAATALESGLSVATDNRKDFQIPGLALLPLP